MEAAAREVIQDLEARLLRARLVRLRILGTKETEELCYETKALARRHNPTLLVAHMNDGCVADKESRSRADGRMLPPRQRVEWTAGLLAEGKTTCRGYWEQACAHCEPLQRKWERARQDRLERRQRRLKQVLLAEDSSEEESE